jgi:hypothetical protein
MRARIRRVCELQPYTGTEPATLGDVAHLFGKLCLGVQEGHSGVDRRHGV